MSEVERRLDGLTDEQKRELLLRLLAEHPSVESGTARGLAAEAEAAAASRQVERRAPLSFAQRRLWFIDQLEGGQSALYNIPMTLRLRGRLDAAALERAFSEVVRRHESLRTTFEAVGAGGEPEQVIHAWEPFRLEAVDLTGLGREEAERMAASEARDVASRPFDLMRGPLLRARLVRVDAEEQVLCVAVHHIISDGWSTGVLVRELATLYGTYLGGGESPLGELPIQYADYAARQREWLGGGELERQLSYWRAQLGGGVEELALPRKAGAPRAGGGGHAGAGLRWRLGAELTEGLRGLARREGATLFMTLLAGFQVLLYRYTGQEGIAVGTPIANRKWRDVEGLIGFFVNTLVLRTELGGGPSFREVLRRVREVCLRAYEHQDVPFERVVAELAPRREAGATPLFQVMFALQNAPAARVELPGLTSIPFKVGVQKSVFDLSLAMWEVGDEIAAGLTYNSELFEAEMIERLVEHFRTLLEGIVADPQRRIQELPLLTERERRQILLEWNDTAAPYPRDTCIHELFEAHVAAQPEALAVVCQDGRLSYGELGVRANRLAHYLQGLGVGPEVRVAILLERSFEMIVSVFGVLKAGGAYVPMDPAYPKQRLAFMLEDARPLILLTQEHLVEGLDLKGVKLVCLDTLGQRIEAESSETPRGRASSQHAAYVIYTSGSTGKPKGMLLAHEGLCNEIVESNRLFNIDASSRVLQFASFGFDVAVWEICMAMAAGATLVLRDPRVAFPGPELLTQMREQEVSVALLPPSLMSLLDGDDLPALRTVVAVGEKCSAEAAARWSAAGRSFFNGYGPAECTVTVSVYLVGDDAGRFPQGPPIGRPTANVEMYILDPQMQPLPVGLPGEIYVGGIQLARGYLNRPGLTAEKFVPNSFSSRPGARLYRTGDIARYLPDGNIEFIGRRDHQVKIRGYRIELGEIEAALNEFPGVRESIVMAREDVADSKALVAYFVGEPELASRVMEMRRTLKAKLPEYMVPAAFVPLEAWPRTSNGKVDRSALPAPDNLRANTNAAFQPARDYLELKLQSIWEDVLNFRPVGIHDNFFDLGGHSMLALRLLVEVQRAFDKNLPLSTLLSTPTIETLAAVLRQNTCVEQWPSLLSITPGDARPPLFFVHSVGGNVMSYVELARQLGPEQPFYALQSRGLDGTSPPLTRIEEMASHYISEMRGVQPAGPYSLGGWSMGGIIAFEMARQLSAQGEEVALLALLDSTTSVVNKPGEECDETTSLYMFVRDLKLSAGQTDWSLPEQYNSLRPGEQLAAFLDCERGQGVLPLGLELKELRHLLRVFEENVRAMWRYVPRPYEGRITLFRASERLGKGSPEEYLGWGELAAAGIDERVVPGNHYTILRAPNVAALASQLKELVSESSFV